MKQVLSLVFLYLMVFGCTPLAAKEKNRREPKKNSFSIEIEKIVSNPNRNAWMRNRINRDLDGIDIRNFHPDYINHVFKKELSDPHLLCCLVEILNNKVRLQKVSNFSRSNENRVGIFLKFLKVLAKHFSIPDCQFVITFHDGTVKETLPFPVFCFAKDKDKKGIVIPDFEAQEHYLLPIDGRILTIDILVDKGCFLYPWENKIPRCFWRGSTTGAIYKLQDWDMWPRSQLVLFASKHPEYIDAKFTAVCQAEDGVEQCIKQRGLFGSSVSIDNSLKYKYLIDVDGNSCTYSRSYWILRSNSVLFKHTSNQIQWYYDLLIPWENYIPIAYDFSDLLHHMAWAYNHDEEAKQIALRGRKLAKEELSHEAVFAYFYLLLEEYARRQMLSISLPR